LQRFELLPRSLCRNC
jgi:hypothetical protein